MNETPLINDKNRDYDEIKEQNEYMKSGSFNVLDAQFFQSLNDFKSDSLFNRTESILAKPPHIYRQVSIFSYSYKNSTFHFVLNFILI